MYIYLHIFPKSCGEHIKHIQAILQCLTDNLLNMKALKCKSHSFLRYSFGQGPQGPFTIFSHPPESERQFVVEVNASDAGVGAILSQPEAPHLHLLL